MSQLAPHISSRPLPQAALAAPATITGVGLFTAAQTALTIRPAPVGHGIVFRRTDLPDQPRIPALIDRLIPESRHTVLSANPADRAAPVIHTVEHILSALAGLGINDALLDLHGPEVPIGDGSALLFTEPLLDSASWQSSSLPSDLPPHPRPITISEPITLTDSTGLGRIEALPPAADSRELILEYHLDYGANSPIPPQHASLRLPLDSRGPSQDFLQSIAPARTFCLAEEAQAMRKLGFFKHLEPRDMLVIGEDGQPIDNTLRFPDEPARHKLLDLLGDLALAGRPIIGRIIATRSGHTLNHTLAQALAQNAEGLGPKA